MKDVLTQTVSPTRRAIVVERPSLMVVLIDSENMAVSMKDEGNGIVQSHANLALAWNFEAVMLGGFVIIFTPRSCTIST